MKTGTHLLKNIHINLSFIHLQIHIHTNKEKRLRNLDMKWTVK